MKDRTARPAKRLGRKKGTETVFFKRKDIQEWWSRVVKNPNFQKVLEAAYSNRKFKKTLYEHEHQQRKADDYNDGFSDMASVLEELASYKPSKKTSRDETLDHAIDPDLDDALNDEYTEID